MKKLILFLLCSVFPAHADFLDEQDLYTADKSCKIHYLTAKQKNLWTIEVDKSYCKEGLVSGFTSVILKDSLNRTTETLHGFFHQGYWLTDFTGPINQFYRFSPDDGIQDFIYQTGQDKDLNLTYYLVARATYAQDQHYSAFTQCSENPILLMTHEPTSDFKKSLFQSAVIKAAQTHFLNLCPNAKNLQILAVSDKKINTDSAVFQADIDFTEESITTTYHDFSNTVNMPKPTELRHENAENILTIKPNIQDKITTSYETQANTPDTKEPHKKQNGLKSAIDLALLAQITGKNITGKTVVYVDHTDAHQRAVVTLPTPLFLQSQTALSSGWHIIQGSFLYNNHEIIVQLMSAKQCQKEWCFDEN